MQGSEADLVNDAANHNFALNGVSLSQNALSNIQVYAFKGADQNNMGYNHRVFNMTQTDNVLSMVMPADTWDFVLLSAETGDLGAAIIPAVGSLRQSAKMWECPSANGKLLSAPEIITARTGEITVTAGGYHTAGVSMVRNVAMIRIAIAEAAGLKVDGTHKVSLLDVPTSLTWAGGLYPNQTSPDVSSLPMESAAVISDGAGDSQYSDQMTFLVPAHQGSDFLSANPQDTTTHYLTIQVDLEQESNNRLIKTAVLPLVPKANKILDVKLSVKGQMNVDATILDWKEVDVKGDIVRTTLNVSKTNCAMPWRDTVYVESNAVFTTSVAADWLTATKLDDHRVLIEANTSSYVDGTPRESWVDIVANNVTKRINVRQRPDVGTITATPDSFWASPTMQQRSFAVTSSGPWVVMDGNPSNGMLGVHSGNAGTTNVTFLRHASSLEDTSIYGDAVIRLKNTQSLEIITVTASNLHIVAPAEINAQGSGGTSWEEIVAMGMSEEYVIKQINYNSTGSGWLTASIDTDGRLKLTVTREPNENTRNCELVIAHKDDPNYTVAINIIQDPFYDIIDPFTFLAGRFLWESYSTDLDIGVFIYDDHGMSIFAKGKYMGYNQATADAEITFRNQVIAKWGGDPVSSATDIESGGEAFVVYMNAFDNLTAFPLEQLDRFINIYMYAWWYSSSSAPTKGDVWLSLDYWLGGYMDKALVGTSTTKYYYFNVGGTNKNPDAGRKLVSPVKYRGTGSANALGIINHSNGMDKIARVRYDRLTHKANIVWYTESDISNWPITNEALSQTAP